MGERRPVEMVRIEQPEQVYDVEAVLGRDAASVFPNMAKEEADPLEALKASIGAKRFVTESELEKIKAARGLTVDDGTASVDKPLAEILAEKKQAKQDAFEEQWRTMKTGKNRPLDPDELDFLDHLAQREAAEAAAIRSQDAAELDAYREAVAAAAAAKAAAGADEPTDDAGGDARGDAGPEPGSSGVGLARSGSSGAAAGRKPAGPGRAAAASKPVLPALKPLLKVRPKGAAPAAAGGAGGSSLAAQPDSKRPRLEGSGQQRQQQAQPEQAEQQPSLAGLLGGYGSDSD